MTRPVNQMENRIGGGWVDRDFVVRLQRKTRHQGRQKLDSGCYGDHSSENQTGDPQTRKQVAESDKTGTQTGPAILYVN